MLIIFFWSILLSALLAFSPFKLWWLACFFLTPLYFSTFNLRFKITSLFLLSILSCLAYFGVASFWLTKYTMKYYLIILAVLVWVFPVYFGLLRFLYKRFQKRFPILISLVLWFGVYQVFLYSPFRTIAIDFPFLGTPLTFLQGIKWGGFITWPLLLLGFQSSLAMWLCEKSRKREIILALFLLLIFANTAYGYVVLQKNNIVSTDKIALIQHNLPMDVDWRRANAQEILDIYEELALEAKKQKPDLIVFPLYTITHDTSRNPKFFSELSKRIGVPLILTGHTPEKEGEDVFHERYRNLALLISQNGIENIYHSVAAPPEFGKKNDLVAEDYKILETRLGKFGILLCYEDTIPYLAQEAKKQGAKAILALSNPGHFIETLMPRIYLVQDQLRAIETGLPVYRLSTNGYSAVIDPRGRILKQTELKERQILYSH